jgi:hypothetical protein
MEDDRELALFFACVCVCVCVCVRVCVCVCARCYTSDCCIQIFVHRAEYPAWQNISENMPVLQNIAQHLFKLGGAANVHAKTHATKQLGALQRRASGHGHFRKRRINRIERWPASAKNTPNK